MDRRKALKGIGLSLGYVIAAPTVISLLHSCTKEPQTDWKPLFFNPKEAAVMQRLVELILPDTGKYPGAADLGIPVFIDAYFKDVANDGQQKLFKNGITEILSTYGNPADKDYHKLLSKYLKADSKEIGSFKKDKKENILFHFLTDLRTLCIWAYKSTEKIGEEFLAYDPIPGKFEGCVSLKETTGGRAWSL